ncbi:MAG: PfkB family carbohydrate kinase [Microgenomates group bacterium]
MAIVVTGSIGYDYIMGFQGKISDRIMPDKIHTISLSLLADKLHKQFGGTAGNIAYSLKLLGVEPIVQTYAGNDFASYREFWNKHAIATHHVAIDQKNSSGTYFVVTDQADNQIGAYYKGALVRNTSLHLSGIHERFELVVISANEPKAMVQYVTECAKQKIPYMYDPSFQIGNFSKKELYDGVRHAAMLIGNDYEIALLEKRLEITHSDLLALCPIVITTLGAKGSLIETREKRIPIRPAKVKAIVDPTGAGDAYRSGFLGGFTRGFDLKTCGQMGSIAAVYTVEEFGTQTHMYTKKEFCTRYKKNYKNILSL